MSQRYVAAQYNLPVFKDHLSIKATMKLVALAWLLNIGFTVVNNSEFGLYTCESLEYEFLAFTSSSCLYMFSSPNTHKRVQD